MTRLLLYILGALLAFSAFVRSEDKLRVYSFSGNNCDGSPQLVNLDIKKNECHTLANGANSFRSIWHHDDDWLKDVNKGETVCSLATYSTQLCVAGSLLESFEMPEELQECHTDFSEIPALSIRFECRSSVSTVVSTSTETKVRTSWSIGADGKATPSESLTTRVHTHSSTVELARRAAETADALIEPRQEGKNNHKGVWMLHPWALSLICYDCYTYNTDDFTQFDCRSGPKNTIACGPKPATGLAAIQTSTSTSTSLTTSTTFTLTPVTTSTVRTGTNIATSSSSSSSAAFELAGGDIDAADGDIEKRSWHRRVLFQHPYKTKVTLVCADAEWEKRGKPENEIRLQDISTKLSKCEDHPDVKVLNPAGVQIANSTTTTTATTHTVRVMESTKTTTVSILGNMADRDTDEEIEAAPLDAAPSHRDL